MIRFLCFSALVVSMLAPTPSADAGWFRCHRRARRCQAAPVACTARQAIPATAAPSLALGSAPTPQAASQALAHAPVAGSVLGWLNSARAARGLRPLAWSDSAAADAAANSRQGFGHWTRSYGRGQVVGTGPLGSVQAAWLASPAHYRILMDPGATSAGFGGAGAVWTIDVN